MQTISSISDFAAKRQATVVRLYCTQPKARCCGGTVGYERAVLQLPDGSKRRAVLFAPAFSGRRRWRWA